MHVKQGAPSFVALKRVPYSSEWIMAECSLGSSEAPGADDTV